ncbi:MAG TPA: serine/threonine-protein kinase, partial [Burkholderiales bacterium]|nr:serine/threonine-protein kinase [Burkholderiales bacterium]
MGEPLPEQIGKYPIVRQLGRGATSVVYLARDPFANREVAIKVIRNQPEQDTDLRRRYRRVFLNEAALVGKLFHPHILTIYDAVSDENLSYIVMEFVDGKTLEHYCDVANLLPVSKIVEIIFKCSLALGFAQRHGVIHCDIKPANILIKDDIDIKLSDFGAALYEEAQHTHLKGIGSPAYMSPEQVQEKEVTYQTDIYSLGVVMYQMLTGKLPFRASSKASLLYQVVHIPAVPPSTFRREVPAELDRLVLRCLEKDAEARYQTWSDFSREL